MCSIILQFLAEWRLSCVFSCQLKCLEWPKFGRSGRSRENGSGEGQGRMWECRINYFGWWFACLGRLHQPLIKPAYCLSQVFSCFNILPRRIWESITLPRAVYYCVRLLTDLSGEVKRTCVTLRFMVWPFLVSTAPPIIMPWGCCLVAVFQPMMALLHDSGFACTV